MSEFRSRDKNYFNEHQRLINDISGTIRHLARGALYVVMDMREEDPAISSISGAPSAAELLAIHPEIDEVSAAELATLHLHRITSVAKIAAVSLNASVNTIQITREGERLKETDLTEEEQQAYLGQYQLLRATSAVWQRARHYDRKGDVDVDASAIDLLNQNEAPYASNVEIALTDAFITRSTNISHFNGELEIVHSRIRPIEDELLTRVVSIVDSEVLPSVTFAMAGRVENDDIDAFLNEVWAYHQGTAQEQEIGPLLDQVRDRYYAATESKALNLEFGFNQPSVQELMNLSAYLKQS